MFLAGAALMMSQPAALAACVGNLCQPAALDPWFRKLAHARRDPGHRPLHIIQIGDSHTAGDAITGTWRDMLQARFGPGGRGVLPPGRPYKGYVVNGADIAMSPDWTIRAAFGSGYGDPKPRLGISGFTLETQVEGAWMALTAAPQQAFDRVVLCGLARPGAGRVTVRFGPADAPDGRSEEFDLGSLISRPDCKSISLPGAATEARLSVSGGPVAITSWATFRDEAGIALSNLGIVGSQLSHFGRSDEAVVAEELRAYRPDLIVVAFGTNEGFAPRLEPGQYELQLRAQISRIRRLAPHVPLLMLGAPDAATRNDALRVNAAGEAIDCNLPATPLAESLADLAVSEAKGEGAQTPVDPLADPINRPLFVPPAMAMVRAIQRRVAASLGIAYWDWQAAMGGACSSVRRVRADPPLMRGDFVHYTRAGGSEIARLLDADLVAAATLRAGK